jgi:hypothetical protein
MAMIKVTPDQLRRDEAAREEWIIWRCSDMPAIYRAQIPTTCDAKMLLAAEKQIRAMMAEDLAAMNAEKNNPWVQKTTKPKLVDFSEIDSHTLAQLGLPGLRVQGLRAMVKPGFMDHPDVKKAMDVATLERTAERVAHKRLEEIEPRYRELNTAYVNSVNTVGEDDPQTKQLAADLEAVQSEYAAADAECKRLANDWEAASKIVTDDDGEPAEGETSGPRLAQ